MMRLTLPDKIRSKIPAKVSYPVVLILVASIMWLWIFRGFISGQLALSSDAESYFDHIKFFIDNLTRGIFPLWDPHWEGGVPNDFFLRRIGPYNPFLCLIPILETLGLPYRSAYVLYMGLYYLAGCVGFYLLARRVLKDELSACAGYLMLLFSALGTRIFDSYIVLVFVPLAWFFYFLVAMTEQPRRLYLLGITLCTMILLTTYIPFYFMTVVWTFVLCFAVVRWNDIPEIGRRYLKFFRSNTLLTAVCVLAIVYALLPGIMFFKSGSSGEFVLPARNTNTAVGNVLGVESQTQHSWSIVEDVYYANLFPDLREYFLALFYIPPFTTIVFLMGLFTLFNRKLLVMGVWAVFLFTVTSPVATGVYKFLYANIFYFKYFRNLHFFLWIAFLPLFVLFVSEQLRQFLQWKPRPGLQRNLYLAMILMGHAVYFTTVFYQERPLISSFLAGLISLIFFIFYGQGRSSSAGWRVYGVLFLAVVLQPLEVYHYLTTFNVGPRVSLYRYEMPFLKFQYTRGPKEEILPKKAQLDARERLFQALYESTPATYYATSWYNLLAQKIDGWTFREYLRHRCVIYDRVRYVKDDQVRFETLEENFAHNINEAIIAPLPGQSRVMLDNDYVRPEAELLEGNADEFSVVHYDVNTVTFKTNFPAPKFFVYNDSYHSDWRAFVNGHPVDVYRANMAFKGIWLPEGENIVTLRFSRDIRYVIEWGLFLVFYAVAGGLFWVWREKCIQEARINKPRGA